MDPPGQSGDLAPRAVCAPGIQRRRATILPESEDRHGADPSPASFASAPCRHRAEARLQGQYRSGAGARPRHRRTRDHGGRCGHDDVPQARLFLCAAPECRAQACICRPCDRGHIYCADCAPHARRRSVRQAGERYQASRRGRIKHAERARRYRSRANKVTHHGSPPDPTNAFLTTEPAVIVEKPLPPDSQQPPRPQRWVCLRCGRRCSDHLRQDLPRRRLRRNRRRGPDHDDSA